MALDPLLIEVPFATGLQEKTDPKLVDVGAATSLLNGVLDKHGVVTKRPGTTAISTAGAISAWGHSMGVSPSKSRVFRNVIGGLAAIDQQRVWAYMAALGKWTDVDAVPTLTYEEFGITSGLTNVVSQDVATNGIHVAMVYTDTTNACFLVVCEVASRAVVYGPQSIATPAVGASYARVCLCNGVAVVVWQSSVTPTSLYARGLTIATMTLGAQTLLRNDHTPTPGRFDVHTVANVANAWALSHNRTPAATPLRVELFTSALTSTASASFTVGAGMNSTIYGVTLHATSGEQIWCAYSCPDAAIANQHTRVFGLNPTTLAVTTADTSVFSFATVLPDVARIGIERMTATSCMVVSSMQTNSFTQFRPMTTAGPSWTNERVQYSHVLASKPFTIDSNVCCSMVVPASSASGGTYVVVDLAATTAPTPGVNPQGRPVCTIAPRVVQRSVANFILLPSAAQYSGNAGIFLTGSSIRNGQGTIGLDLIDVAAPFNVHQVAELGGTLYFSGGVPSQFDGQRYAEIGFLQTPPGVTGTPAAGGAMAAGNYTYLVVYEWTDATGARAQSSPATSGTIAVPAAGQVTLSVECQHMTTKEDAERPDRPVGVAIYRTTLVGGTGIFYRVFGAAFPATAIGSASSLAITYVDQLADASIVVNETYNTQQLVNGCPPSLSCLVAHQGRLAGANGNTVWLSKQYDGGTNQPQFSDTLTIQVGDGGKITALASMDGQLVVFKRNSIFVIAGDGPNTSGIGSTWSDPRLISSDVGCTSDWRSTLVTKDGVIFQSEKKLHMLTRGFEVVYLSQPVESLLATYPTVDFVAANSRRDEIRVGVRAFDGDTEGRVLNWNYVTGCWSEFDYSDQWDGSGPAAHAAFAGGASVDGQFCYVNAFGWVHRENVDLSLPNACLDTVAGGASSRWVTLQLESAWVKASGVLGWGRFWYARFRRADGDDAHDLTLSVAHDYSSTYTQSGTFTAAQQASFATPDVELHIGVQKCSAVRAKVSDAPPTGASAVTGAGPTLVGMHFEAGIYRKGRRIPSAQGA